MHHDSCKSDCPQRSITLTRTPAHFNGLLGSVVPSLLILAILTLPRQRVCGLFCVWSVVATNSPALSRGYFCQTLNAERAPARCSPIACGAPSCQWRTNEAVAAYCLFRASRLPGFRASKRRGALVATMKGNNATIGNEIRGVRSKVTGRRPVGIRNKKAKEPEPEPELDDGMSPTEVIYWIYASSIAREGLETNFTKLPRKVVGESTCV